VRAGLRSNPAWPVVYKDNALRFGDFTGWGNEDFETYLNNIGLFPTFSACLNKLIALALMAPLYQADRATGKRLDKPRLLNWRGEDLISRPNPGEGRNYFLAKSYQQLAVTGNLYHACAQTMTDPKELWVLESRHTRPRLSRSNQYPFDSFVYEGAGGAKEVIEADRVIVTRRPHPKELVKGLSFTAECRDALEMLWLSRRYNKLLLQRGGRSGGILNIQGGLGDMERRRIERRLEERQRAENAGKIVVTSAADATFTPDTTPPRDMEHGTTTEEAKFECYNVFGFMPALFATRDVNRSNLREAKASAFEDCVIGFVELMLEQWNASEMCVAAGVLVLADWKAIPALQPNFLEQAQALALMVDRTVASPNEAAAQLGFSRKPWGDEPYRAPALWPAGWAPIGIEPKDPPADGADGEDEVRALLAGAGREFDISPEAARLAILRAPSGIPQNGHCVG
jgi:hypothetical protein